jgi:transposase
MPKEIDHICTKEIVCPYCGYTMSDSWEMEDDGSWTCDACNNEFRYQRNISVSYTSRKKECKTHSFKVAKVVKSLTDPVYDKKTDLINWVTLATPYYFEVSICTNCDKEKFRDITQSEYDSAQGVIKL